ncbi:fimbrial protein [Pantoea sp. 1.19]|uniref:fimbrial protein n=1 Tax=Pantoea sp. 1.19 TaxID=1925589 RepID=UPI00147AF8F4|nr:fimbrial protein [Pantoea sp. 1.19]
MWSTAWNIYDDTINVSGTFSGISVARSAPIGSIIGDEKTLYINWSGYAYLYCYSNPIIVTAINTSAAAPVDVVANGYPTSAGRVFPTNIPGVGVLTRIKTFGNIKDSLFFPLNQQVPAGSYTYTPTLGVLLVKIGDIEPGTHVVKGKSSLTTLNNTFLTSDFSITLTAESCTVANAGAVTSVPMGNVSISTLHPTSKPQRFQIPLTNCATGSSLNNIVNVTFTPVNGSTIVDAVNGITGLDSTSTAKGVGVQILREDGVTAFPLGTATPAGAITRGETVLNFYARYIKTADSPQAGRANAKVNFTVSYK